MKITLVGPVYPYRGGIAHFTTMLALKLQEQDHDVQVLSFKKQFPKWLYPGKSDKDESEGRIKVEAAYVLSPLNPLDWIRTLSEIKAFKPDVVVFQWWVTFWGLAYRFILRNLAKIHIPTIILVHNTVPHEKWFFDELLAKRALREGSRFIVMTGKEKNHLQALFGSLENISIVPLPIYRLFNNSGSTKEQIRDELGLPLYIKLLLFFGFVRPYKGLDLLLEAMAILKEKGQDLHLLVVGEFWDDRSKYDLRIHELLLEDQIHIYDRYIPDSEAGKYFEVADLFVAPYLRGTQSGALKIALGYGMPAVVSEVISDDLIYQMPELCTMAAPGNPKALAEAIHQALKNPGVPQETIDKMYDRSWRILTDNICELD